ncbi:divergent polysaccharide deacetylase family protein [Marinomonas sp. 15G1-11]|uniref:Divergent polysaccharide deacetylase family protein n=1 Tax=Marinomonas phaeophyticola TaxID=3004091 RepID=A0ABT4JZF7_9GAMM|nr:divergent polysaccharide deacetylase family protein [Marinomonas sp. 15G1-11]MCZ2723626.1 divergent polysaccharide deacetylase family protein [Marinomonas sp. 15G1-11]
MYCVTPLCHKLKTFCWSVVSILSVQCFSSSLISEESTLATEKSSPPFLLLRNGPSILPNYDEYFVDHFNKSKQLNNSFFGPIIKQLNNEVEEGSHKGPLSPTLSDDVPPKAQDSLHTALKPSPKQSMDSLPAPAKISIVIDDLGYNRKGMEGALALPNAVALAILPHTPFSKKTAAAANKTNRLILLHAPMENKKSLRLGPGGLYSDMEMEEFKQTLLEDLESISGIVGVNNHMGSLLTQKSMQMKWVMDIIAPKKLFFLDSVTTSDSVAQKTAQDYGLQTAKRDVFLDNIPTEKAIAKQFDRLLKVARENGSAIAIGHPYPETMHFLLKRLDILKKDGVILVPLDMQLK